MKATDKTYLNLIKQFPLCPIRSDEDLERASSIIEILTDQVLEGHKLTEGEQNYRDALSILIAAWEVESPKIQAFRSRLKPPTPQELLLSFMQDHNLSQSELARRIQCPQSLISAFLKGERGISKSVIARLAELFKVSTDVFISTSKTVAEPINKNVQLVSEKRARYSSGTTAYAFGKKSTTGSKRKAKH